MIFTLNSAASKQTPKQLSYAIPLRHENGGEEKKNSEGGNGWDCHHGEWKHRQNDDKDSAYWELSRYDNVDDADDHR